MIDLERWTGVMHMFQGVADVCPRHGSWLVSSGAEIGACMGVVEQGCGEACSSAFARELCSISARLCMMFGRGRSL